MNGLLSNSLNYLLKKSIDPFNRSSTLINSLNNKGNMAIWFMYICIQLSQNIKRTKKQKIVSRTVFKLCKRFK